MYERMKQDLEQRLHELETQGLYKIERVLQGAQGPEISVRLSNGKTISALNFCANNYLGLANRPELIAAATKAMQEWGYGLSSVRFICGTQEQHRLLEQELSAFLGTEDTILFSSCFDANGGVFEALLDADSAILTDALNHASIIDGVRLCKARRLIYNHMDMADLEQKLREAADAKYRMIVTDGVFSMDGDIADLKSICDLADQYDALVLVDDSHATGFIGPHGRGTAEHWNIQDRVDLITTTFGKALGGASGGCVSGRRELIQWLRQKARPYLFSNTLAPAIVGATREALRIAAEAQDLRNQLARNTMRFRRAMEAAGFTIRQGHHPIVPIMLGDEKLAVQMAKALLDEGIYVIAFSYPVVPRGLARIRVQLSAVHTDEMVDRCVAAFIKVGKALGALKT
ncbi:glycine C-acetyltransferase [Gracilinema caldarium]|uniref:2-amino-3-ketobutyrate coenzyme A ligase n=1 Tax=Gracilinema caldarium (strain ATCC 51460 / DSM 7334 / H1) TaxID=744872 RepID=F8EX93_GRAC1|nr:glycine C-acetyltransferase [Gracilinema caldarium]AEJ18836.1 2-amino-3-ketobutyrate coenzyme A ligase [Gracilinema caldarium DSM 7334]